MDELKHIVEIIKWGLQKDETVLNTKDEQSTFKPLITRFKCKYMLYTHINTQNRAEHAKVYFVGNNGVKKGGCDV